MSVRGVPGVWSTHQRLSDTVEVQSAALFRRSDGSVIPGRFAYRVVVTTDGTAWRGSPRTYKAAMALAMLHVGVQT